MESTATVIESQADWLTLTHPDWEPISNFNLWSHAVLRAEESGGNKRTPWGMKGYQGWHCGRASWGVRDQGAILCLSGDAAHQRLHTALDLATNVTRLDLAVTVRLDPPDTDLEARHWREYYEWHAERHSTMKGTIVRGVDASHTMYVGSRQSELFLRIYNKDAESRNKRTREPDPRYIGCHRYELEVKGDRARKLAHQVSLSPTPNGLVRGLVADYLVTHGIEDSLVAESREAILPGFRRRSDVDTKLDWLAHQVRSTCDWLKDHGHQAKVLHALGYDTTECLRVLKLQETSTGEEGQR